MSQTTSEPSKNEKVLFWASFMTLIAAGIGFSVRGVVLEDWGQQFGFTQSELGTITGGGLVGFGLAIIFFSFFADLFGYGKLMLVAFLLHAASAVVTFAATPVYAQFGKEGAFWCLNVGLWLFALGNGTCEAVINPLTATLFPRNKTHWLNILHAGWPLGLVLGAAITLGFGQVTGPIRWEFKLGMFLIPVLIYGVLMFNKPFPRSEASTAGIPLRDMMRQVGLVGFTLAAGFIGLALATLLPDVLHLPAVFGYVIAGLIWLAFAVVTGFAPGHWLIAFMYLIHAMVGYVELGTDSWILNITKRVLGDADKALLAFIWTNILMFTLRFFAGPIVHKISPIGLLFFSAVLGAAGLYALGQDFTSYTWPWIAAVTVYGIGKTFYWPTMLGVISERFPKGGALALGISGGIGMISAGVLGSPGIGYKQDYAAVKEHLNGTETYARYKSDKETGFPFVSDLAPQYAPKVAGLDNGKLKVFDDHNGNVAAVESAAKNPPKDGILPKTLDKSIADYIVEVDKAKADGKPEPKYLLTTLESDLVTLAREEKAGRPPQEKLAATLNDAKKWWDTEGLPHFTEDKEKLEGIGGARVHGAKKALVWTAAVPATMAVCYLLLILFFKLSGGYKQDHI